MIAMLHKVEYELDGATYSGQSSMVALGEDPVRTAMAKTVGLTTGIGAKLVLDGVITQRGAVIPTMPAVYKPILRELEQFGICFQEQEQKMS